MLEQELIKYTSSNAYPFHMPGHKMQGLFGADPYQLDITEICDFDNCGFGFIRKYITNTSGI